MRLGHLACVTLSKCDQASHAAQHCFHICPCCATQKLWQNKIGFHNTKLHLRVQRFGPYRPRESQANPATGRAKISEASLPQSDDSSLEPLSGSFFSGDLTLPGVFAAASVGVGVGGNESLVFGGSVPVSEPSRERIRLLRITKPSALPARISYITFKRQDCHKTSL